MVLPHPLQIIRMPSAIQQFLPCHNFSKLLDLAMGATMKFLCLFKKHILHRKCIVAGLLAQGLVKLRRAQKYVPQAIADFL